MNKSNYFILPLVGLNTRSYGPKNLIDTFLSLDCKSVIIELLYFEPDPIKEILSPENFKRVWNISCKYYLEYIIPEKFSEDVSKFLRGEYSQFSEEAKVLMRTAIRTEVFFTHPPTEDLLEYISKVTYSRHKLCIIFFSGYRHIIAPAEFGAIAAIGDKSRDALKEQREHDLGIALDDSVELLDKPLLYNEIIDEEIYNHAGNRS